MTRQRLLVGLGIWLIAIAACVHAGPAQDVLEDLAVSARAERMASGAVSLGVGAAIGLASAVFFMGTEFGVYGLIAGGLVALPGAVMLFLPTAAELEYAASGDSEAAAALALDRLADEGRRGRFLSGIGNVAAGVAALVYPVNLFTPYDSLCSAAASLVMAAYDFLVPSREEAAYERYRALAEQGA